MVRLLRAFRFESKHKDLILFLILCRRNARKTQESQRGREDRCFHRHCTITLAVIFGWIPQK